MTGPTTEVFADEVTGLRSVGASSTRPAGRRLAAWGTLLALVPFVVASTSGARSPRRAAPPNDPLLVEQWYLRGAGGEGGTPGGIGAIEAWGRIRPARPIVVALLDGGINTEHPDLAANVWTNDQEEVNGKDDDGNGYVDDLHGWNFVNGNGRPKLLPTDYKFPDQVDHGTAVAGLLAAVPDNGIGIAGVGRNVKVMPLRVVGGPEVAGGPHAPAAETFPAAIRYAIRGGARVIVAATPLFSAPEPGRPLDDALGEAERANVLFIRSAGNHAQDVGGLAEYQWLSRFSNVLVVGGTTRDGGLSPRLNFGSRVGIVAPCVDMTLLSFDGYARHAGPGTSYAAPLVAAAAATLLSQAPDLAPPQVITRLKAAARSDPEFHGKVGGGRLDLDKLFP